MGEEHHQDQQHEQHAGEQSKEHTEQHGSQPPIGHTKHEQIYLQLYENLKPILPGHHHSHHHKKSNIQYKAPEQLNKGLALYAIKKLSVLDPHMPQKDQRIINPVRPGVLSWMAVMGAYGTTALWGIYVWRTLGFKGFLGKGGLVFAGLWGASLASIRVCDELREMSAWWRRSKLVNKYRSKYGDEYLLQVLDPSFRLAHHH